MSSASRVASSLSKEPFRIMSTVEAESLLSRHFSMTFDENLSKLSLRKSVAIILKIRSFLYVLFSLRTF